MPAGSRAVSSAFPAVALVSALAAVGCTSLRPHDDQRLTVAQEAVALADELAQSVTDPFAAMEANVDTVFQSWTEIDALQSKDRADTFYAVLGDMTRAQLRDEVESTLQLHLAALSQADREVARAAADVKDQLDRQEQVNKVLGAPSDARLATVLAAVEKRIAWLQGLQVDVARALAAINTIDPKSSNAKQLEKARELSRSAAGTLEAARSFVNQIQNDPQVAAAGQLLLRSGQEIAQGEQDRLLLMRQYLKTVEQQRDALDRRNLVYFQSLLFPALAMVADEQEWSEALQQVEDALEPRAEARKGDPGNDPGSDQQVLDLIGVFRSAPQVTRAIAARQTLWCEGCRLTGFVDASLRAQEAAPDKPSGCPPPGCPPPPGESAAPPPGADALPATQGIDAMKNLVASLGILLFVEEPADRGAVLELAKERHLHSIRLSRVNSQERLALVHQVAQGLQIYYQGGLTPSEAAQAILLASQILAIAFIGTQI